MKKYNILIVEVMTMLIRINVGNFLSFNNVQEFSMLAGKVRNKSNRLFIDSSIKLLKFAAIFGANASGKSNLISAMKFVQNMVTIEFPKDASWKYCKLYSENKEKASYFEFELKLNNKYFSYGFEAILSKQFITSEWLYEICPSGQEKEIFTRNTIDEKYSVAKYFSSKELLGKLDVYADDIRSDGSVLLLKLLNQNKNTLYADYEESKVFRAVFKWFKTQLDINFPDRPISSYSYFVSNQDIKTICLTLEAFGTGITKYSIVETNFEKMSKEIPPKLVDEIVSKLNEQKSSDDDEKKQPSIILRGDKSFFIFENNDENNITCKTIHFNHGNDNIFFELSEESDGTIRLLDLLTVLFDNQKGSIFIIDEIDRCLHPQLTEKFITEYLKIAVHQDIQLIVSTHESRLLDFDLLRKDEIWFVDKNGNGESTVYSLDEYNERFDKKIDKAYLEGRYGGVPVFSTVFPVEGV